MNQKFSIKIAALVATFTGTAFGPHVLMPAANSQAPNGSFAVAPKIVSSEQMAARSNMLAPITSQQPASAPAAMPWKVDASKYKSAIAPHVPPVIKSQASASSTYNARPAEPASPAEQPRFQATNPSATTKTHVDHAVQPAAAKFATAPKAQLSGGFSAAGIPIYSPSPSPSVAASPAPPVIPARPFARVARAPSATQGSGTRNVIGSGIQAEPAIAAPSMPPAAVSGQVMSPSVMQADPVMPAAPTISADSEMIVGGEQSVFSDPQATSVVDSGTSIVEGPISNGTVIGGTSVVASGPIASDGCSTCNTSVGNTSGAVGCDSCGSCNCGPGGCYNPADITSKAGLYGSVGEARSYAHVEGMYFDRRRGDVTFTDAIRLNGFEGNGGMRLTFGNRFDAINGRELSYMGTAPIEGFNTIDGTSFTVPAPFVTTGDTRAAISPFGFFTEALPAVPGSLGPPLVIPQPAVASIFNPADTLTQSKSSYFHTIEFNRVRWGWDVFKSFVGIRYIYVDDEYSLTGSNANANAIARPGDPNGANATTGQFQIDATNNLIGPHIGAEFFYDVGYRWSVSLNGKLGVYANFNEVDSRLTADGNNFFDREAESTAFASSVEVGLTAHYQISPRGRFRLGYNVFHLEDIATVTGNLPGLGEDSDGVIRRTINRSSGSTNNDNGRMTFLGLAFGLEFFR